MVIRIGERCVLGQAGGCSMQVGEEKLCIMLLQQMQCMCQEIPDTLHKAFLFFFLKYIPVSDMLDSEAIAWCPTYPQVSALYQIMVPP